MRPPVLAFVMLAVAAPLAAQTSRPEKPSRPASTGAADPWISIRPFVMIAEEQFAAQTTFDAVFGQSHQPFWGGGAQVVFRHGLFAELAASRFRKTGERAFRFSGQSFRLGIPLAASITPFEVTGGYRFRVRRSSRIVPYAGAGVGSYAYEETSDFAETGESLDARHVGYHGVGGVEVRLHRWVGAAVDVHFTHVPGLIGQGGLSKDVSETDLGGVAARFKVIVGR